MSYEEKGTWVLAIVTAVTYAAYVVIVTGRAGEVPLTEVSYAGTMLWTIGIAIGLSIVGNIAVAIASPGDGDKRDVRDRQIYRFGEYIGGTVLAVAMILPLALALAEADHFWIANGMYAAFVLGGLVGSVVKLVAYRRGI